MVYKIGRLYCTCNMLLSWMSETEWPSVCLYTCTCTSLLLSYFVVALHKYMYKQSSTILYIIALTAFNCLFSDLISSSEDFLQNNNSTMYNYNYNILYKSTCISNINYMYMPDMGPSTLIFYLSPFNKQCLHLVPVFG